MLSWATQHIVQWALAPFYSLLFSLAVPASFVGCYFLLSTCIRGRRRSRNAAEGKFAVPVVVSAGANGSWTTWIITFMFTCLLIYSQCTLLRHLYNDELRNQKDAADANDLCAKTATLP